MEKERTASSSMPKGGRYLREESKKKPSRQRKRRKQRLLACIIVGILLMAAIVLIACFQTDRIKGTWRYDEVTAYQFDGKGRGKLILPDKEYAFSYEIAEGELRIDFESEAAKDSIYDYSLAENQLTLVGGEGDDSVTYILTR